MAFGDYLEAVKDELQGLDDTALSIAFASLAEDNLVMIAVAAADGFTFDGTGYTELSGAAVVDGADEMKFYYKVAGASETLTVGATIDTSIRDRVMMGWEIEGPFDATPFDAIGSVSTKEAASSSVECPTVTAVASSTVCVAMGYGETHNDQTTGQMNSPGDNGFTFRDGCKAAASSESMAIIFATKLLSSAGAVGETRVQFTDGASATASIYHYGVQATFKEGGGGASGPVIPVETHGKIRKYRQLRAI